VKEKKKPGPKPGWKKKRDRVPLEDGGEVSEVSEVKLWWKIQR
jgi:hypothetical protein